MGAWGAGNFQQDNALDFLGREVQQPLVRHVETMLADPASAQADDPYSGPIMAAVELLALLTEQVNAVPPKPDTVTRWRDTFLPAWDRTCLNVYFRAEDAAARREVIATTFERLLALAVKWHARPAEPGAAADRGGM